MSRTTEQPYCNLEIDAMLKLVEKNLPSNEDEWNALALEFNQIVRKVAAGTVGGAVVGSALVLGGFLLIGLSPLGPIAGGLFAANMGAGLASGSIMAVTQAAAMSGVTYGTAAAVGALGGATAACA